MTRSAQKAPPLPPHGSTKSQQVVSTPTWLVGSIAHTWGLIALDACADASNAKAPKYYDVREDGLSRSWSVEPGHLVYANPPYQDLAQWVEHGSHCARAHGTDVVMLTLASVGSGWWRNFVHGKAEVTFINRIKFDNHQQVFPRDLSILCFGPKFNAGTYRCVRLISGCIQNITGGAFLIDSKPMLDVAAAGNQVPPASEVIP